LDPIKKNSRESEGAMDEGVDPNFILKVVHGVVKTIRSRSERPW